MVCELPYSIVGFPLGNKASFRQLPIALRLVGCNKLPGSHLALETDSAACLRPTFACGMVMLRTAGYQRRYKLHAVGGCSDCNPRWVRGRKTRPESLWARGETRVMVKQIREPHSLLCLGLISFRKHSQMHPRRATVERKERRSFVADPATIRARRLCTL